MEHPAKQHKEKTYKTCNPVNESISLATNHSPTRIQMNP